MKKVTTAIAAALLLGIASAGLAPAAHAAQQPAQSTSQPAGRIIAQDQSVQLSASATKPRQITVRTDPGAQVTVTPKSAGKKAAKKASLTKRADDDGIATFTKLTAGRPYVVRSAGESTAALPVVKVGKTTDLTARTTDDPTSVELTWEHQVTPARGGESISYEVQATPISPETGKAVPGGQVITKVVPEQQTVLEGLDPAAVYEFAVRAVNEIGPGKASTAAMSEPLASLVGAPTPATAPEPAPQPKSTPAAPKPAPAPAPKPNTRTIWVCPSGYTESGDSCTKTAAYTYTTQAYTFHDEVQTKPYTFHTEVTGPAPIISEFSTENVCPAGYNLEDYGAQGKLCRQYGPAPTRQVKDAAPSGWSDNGSSYERTVSVKDATPAGFTDNGSEWVKKDPAPSGWNDDGTQYVKTVAKEARTVPA